LTTTAPRETREVRSAPIAGRLEVRKSARGRSVLRGYALTFGTEYPVADFVERVQPGALTRALRSSTVHLNVAHDMARPLGRTGANLKLREDVKGLLFECTLPDTQDARDVATLVDEGILDQCSWAFTVARDRWDERRDPPLRTLEEVAAIFDVTVVARGANADTSVEVSRAELRARSLQDRIADVASVRPSRISTRSRSPYGQDSDHSFFQDLGRVAMADETYQSAARAGVPWVERLKGQDGAQLPDPQSGGADDARARLKADRESRDSTTTATTSIGEMFGPSTGSVPGFIADLFSLSVRSRAVLATSLPQEPLPKGTTIRSFRLSTGAAAGVQAAQNTGLTEQDPVSSIVESPITTLNGMVDASQQLVDWSATGGKLDVVLGQELGRQLGGTLESEVFIGTGTGGRMRGFFATSGTTTVTVTASPATFPAVWAALMDGRRTHQTSCGAPADLFVMHPRREAFIDNAGTLAAHFNYGMDRLVVSAEVPTNRWTGGTNDAILMFSTPEMALHSAPVRFQVNVDQTGSGALTVRYTCYQFAGLHVRAPQAVTHIAGTLSAPSF
jgi:HK97 family phage prohead protease